MTMEKTGAACDSPRKVCDFNNIGTPAVKGFCVQHCADCVFWAGTCRRGTRNRIALADRCDQFISRMGTAAFVEVC